MDSPDSGVERLDAAHGGSYEEVSARRNVATTDGDNGRRKRGEYGGPPIRLHPRTWMILQRSEWLQEDEAAKEDSESNTGSRTKDAETADAQKSKWVEGHCTSFPEWDHKSVVQSTKRRGYSGE